MSILYMNQEFVALSLLVILYLSVSFYDQIIPWITTHPIEFRGLVLLFLFLVWVYDEVVMLFIASLMLIGALYFFTLKNGV